MLPLADRNPTSRFAIVTALLIAVNVAIFVLWQGGGTLGTRAENEFTFEHAAIPCELTSGRPITIRELRTDTCSANSRSPEIVPDKNVYLAAIVSMFLHGGWVHLLGNMLFLWIFGNNIEDKLGPLAYVGFYLAGGIAATIAQVAFDPNSVVPIIGASGAIAAVMGAYVIWFPRVPILTLAVIFIVEIPAGIWLLIWFVMQFFTAPSSGVAYMAHIGGFAFGAVVALALRNTAWWRRSRPALGYR